MAQFSVAMPSFDECDYTSKHGEGISRPVAAASTRNFTVAVKLFGAPSMKVSLRAESKKKALLYAQNRWPAATVSLVQ